MMASRRDAILFEGEPIGAKLLIGWATATVASVAGLYGSYVLDLPTGAAIGSPLPPGDSVAIDDREGIIAIGYEDGTIQLFDLASAAPIG